MCITLWCTCVHTCVSFPLKDPCSLFWPCKACMYLELVSHQVSLQVGTSLVLNFHHKVGMIPLSLQLKVTNTGILPLAVPFPFPPLLSFPFPPSVSLYLSVVDCCGAESTRNQQQSASAGSWWGKKLQVESLELEWSFQVENGR